MSAGDRLLPAQEQVHERLYDAESMMHIDGSVANGFVILLNGGASPSPKTKKPPSPKKGTKRSKQKQSQGAAGDDHTSLAFMALTCGNVLDACFGVTNPSARRREDTPARRSAQAAKDLLDECATTDSFRRTAVEAYCDAFKAVVVHDEKMSKLNCFTRCFRARKIRRDTEASLSSAFSTLAMAAADSSSSP